MQIEAEKRHSISCSDRNIYCSDVDGIDDMKNPMAAAGAVKDALATGGVDKVSQDMMIQY